MGGWILRKVCLLKSSFITKDEHASPTQKNHCTFALQMKMKVIFPIIFFAGILVVDCIDPSLIRSDQIRSELIRSDLIRSDLIRSDLIRSVFLEANEEVKSLPLSSSSRIPGHQHFFNPEL
jgi:hypothetical protein